MYDIITSRSLVVIYIPSVADPQQCFFMQMPSANELPVIEYERVTPAPEHLIQERQASEPGVRVCLGSSLPIESGGTMTDVPLLHIVIFTSTPAKLPQSERLQERANVWPGGFGMEAAVDNIRSGSS